MKLHKNITTTAVKNIVDDDNCVGNDKEIGNSDKTMVRNTTDEYEGDNINNSKDHAEANAGDKGDKDADDKGENSGDTDVSDNYSGDAEML